MISIQIPLGTFHHVKAIKVDTTHLSVFDHFSVASRRSSYGRLFQRPEVAEHLALIIARLTALRDAYAPD